MIRLSVVMPTNRDSLTAISRIAQACSYAGPHTEVIIRDNSGSASKQRTLAQIENDNCRIITSDPCGAHENWWKAFEVAKGDFVLFISDDDFCFDRGIAAIPEKIESVISDRSVVGILGTTVIDGARGASIVSAKGLDAADPLNRLSGFLSCGFPATVLFSPIRRDVLKWTMERIRQKPLKLSFDDQICILLYLLQGRFVSLDRLFYCYDPLNWESFESAQREDLKYYLEASLDPAINKLHWLMCAFEGAALTRNLSPLSDYSPAQRQAMADVWFAVMFRRFQMSTREDMGSRFSAPAEKLCVKWKAAAGQLSFDAILADISYFLALFAPEHATRYFEFWNKFIGARQAPAA